MAYEAHSHQCAPVQHAVTVETWAGKDEERAGDESAVHARIFDLLMAEAVTGDEARRLIAGAAASLREP